MDFGTAFSCSESPAANSSAAPVLPFHWRASRRPRRPGRSPKLVQALIYSLYSYFTSHLFQSSEKSVFKCVQVVFRRIGQVYAKRRPTLGARSEERRVGKD